MKNLKLLSFIVLCLFGLKSLSAQCDASFNYIDQGNGNYVFVSSSLNSNVTTWNFGDGTIGNGSIVTHTFTNGTFNVCASIVDSSNLCFDSHCKTIGIGSIPPLSCDASYTYSSNGSGSYTFYSQFFNSNTSWDFGDGNFGYGSTITHNFANGTFNVCASIVDSSSLCFDSQCQTIIDTSSQTTSICDASFTYVNNGNGNYTFTTASASSGYYQPTSWNFGDGSYGNGSVVSHTFTNGTFNVCATLADTVIFCSDSQCQTIIDTSSATNPCNASFTYVDNGNGNYTFTGLSNGLWHLGNLNVTIGTSATQTFPNGNYIICFTTQTLSGCTDTSCDTIVVTSGQNNPICDASFTVANYGNGNYTFTSTSLNNNVSWDFGDGTYGNGSPISHTYPQGFFNLCSIISDSATMCFDTQCRTIIDSLGANPICQAILLIYLDTVSNAVIVNNQSIGNNLNYLWDFGDGTTSTLPTPTHTYTTAGPFLFCLTIDDGNVCTNTYCDTINASGVLKQTGFTVNVIDPTVTGINNPLSAITKLTTYPNPTKNNLTIDLELAQENQVEIVVLDLLGNVVKLLESQQMNLGNNQIQFNTSDLTNGIYLLQVKTNNTLKVEKIIINR